MARINNKKTFLVTGGCGFIGSHFIDKVLSLGHKVINIDKMTYASNKDLNFKGEYTFIKEDISKINNIPSCDFIINFAAESHVDNSIEKSVDFINTNILGIHNILELLKNKKIDNMRKAWEHKYPLFIQISTDEVFGDIEVGKPGFIETDVHTPSNPYSATKSSAEQLVVAWARTYGIPFMITRTTNNYGFRQHTEKLIPCTITNLLNNNKVPVHGSGEYIRNWIHVNDNVNAILCIIDKGNIGEYYHVASEEEYSVREIIEIFAKHFNKTFDEVADFSTDRSGADVRYALTYKKIQKLGWKTENSLIDSAKSLIKYYKDKI